MRKIMTNKELAQNLGISPAALSLIINHKPGVSDATRAAALAQIKEMGYEHIIKKIPSAPSCNLCFIIFKRHGEILDLHPFFLLLMENIEKRARAYGYSILLYTIDRRLPMEPQIEYMNGLDCHGAILFATEMKDEDMEVFNAFPQPVVALDNDFPRLTCNSIAINNQMGTFQAVEHLVGNGHSRIGYLKSIISINSFLERQQGYENALSYFKRSFLPEDILEVHYTEEGSYQDIRKYLQEHKSGQFPTAYVCDDDTIAVGAIRAFSEQGIRIPEDISIVGFNDRPSCKATNPPLTSIDVSTHALAYEAVDELMRLIQNQGGTEGETRSRKIRIGTKLVVRESAAAVSNVRLSQPFL